MTKRFQRKNFFKIRFKEVKNRKPLSLKEYLNSKGYEDDGAICDRLIAQEIPQRLSNYTNNGALDTHMDIADGVVSPLPTFQFTEASPIDEESGQMEAV